MDYLDYVTLSWNQKLSYKTGAFFKTIFTGIGSFFYNLPLKIYDFFAGIGRKFQFLAVTFAQGDWKTRFSFLIMGFSNFARGQFVKGLIYLLCELSFIWYMLNSGAAAVTGLTTLGTQTQHMKIVEGQVPVVVQGDNSMLMLLYGVFSLFIILFFIIIYFLNISAAIEAQRLSEKGTRLPTVKDDIEAFLDKKFHITLMLLPCAGIVVFTVMPLIFMILMAFTNYDADHQVPGHLFHWTGIDSFLTLFGVSSGSGMMSETFWPVLGWTVIWAFFATFSNYILGMLLAMLINKKGIRFKKFFRTIFILSMAVPNFVSLLLMRSMLDDSGPLNALLRQLGLTKTFVPFLSGIMPARVTIIVVNLWIGIPYTLLITTGILMNIPAELYEAAKIDGASGFSIYRRIILPYMLYVTTPYLITQFIGNLNNFNVIYLLSGGGPATLDYYQAGKTDLLVTWLYKLTINTNDYCYASAIGICVFILSAIPSLIVYRHTNSYKDEEAFQ